MQRSFRDTSNAIRQAGLLAAFAPGIIKDPDAYVYWIRRDGKEVLWLHAMLIKRRDYTNTQLCRPPRSCGRADVSFVMNAKQWELAQQIARPVSRRWRPW